MIYFKPQGNDPKIIIVVAYDPFGNLNLII